MKKKIRALLLVFVMAFTLAVPALAAPALAAPAAAYGPMDALASNPQYIGIGLLIGVILAFIICFIFKGQLKNVRKGTTAENYVSGSLNLTARSDRFTHRTTIRRKIEKKSN